MDAALSCQSVHLAIVHPSCGSRPALCSSGVHALEDETVTIEPHFNCTHLCAVKIYLKVLFKNIFKINIFFFSFKFTEKNEQRYRVPITSPNTHSFPLLMSYISVMHLLQLMS